VNIVLGVSGGIAAYKAPDLVRRLREAGADVRVILTPNAARFVSPLSLAAVSDHPVIGDQWGDPARGGVDHVEIARWSDLLLIAPATANILAKMAVGIADDALTTYVVAHRSAVVVAPAMNTFMFRHPTVRRNIGILQERGVTVIDPDSGLLACGDEGEGRMPDPAAIARFVMATHWDPRDLEDVRILITAGPTREPIDPVRFLSNRSSGKMGYALASVAAARGATVTLVSGPVSLAPPRGVDVRQVMTAREMYDAVLALAPEHDVVIKAAAVADFEPVHPRDQKIKKDGSSGMQLELRPTPDILEALGKLDDRPFVVAFAAETEDLEHHAEEKLRRKGSDMIVANDVTDPGIGFDSDQNEVLLIHRNGEREEIPRMEKGLLAGIILDRIARARAPKEDSNVG
jgi:phosphopantothenoylcysteine decarboxylase / phosphopantothenate---cysteine ligase